MSKCAISKNAQNQDGRPDRYWKHKKRTKESAKSNHPNPTQERECPTCHHPDGERIRNCAIRQQKDRVSAQKGPMRPMCPEDDE